MKITNDLRKYAAEQGVGVEVDLKLGMESKSKGFMENGAKVYTEQ